MAELRGLTIQLPDGRVEDYRLADVMYLQAVGQIGVDGALSSYFRLTTRDGKQHEGVDIRFYPQSEAPGSPAPLGVDTIGEQE